MFERVAVIDSTGDLCGWAIVAHGQTPAEAIKLWWIDNTDAF